ncbi:MAG TPA: hypothetical protein VFO31_04390 [Vicinamibacterales bacterium]|nr:hypothetical protein [Vicinamibacterales bacterium]
MTYNVYRNGALIASGLTASTYTDQGLSPNTLYQYEVSSVNAQGLESAKAPLAVTTLDVLPVVPTGLTATSITQTLVTMTWQ